jgi:hypothetical protein
MAFTIGELFVNLRANTAQFKNDMRDATDTSNRESSRMSSHFREQTHQANEAAELLSEGIGVRIPRNIRRLIAESSLIGPALSAAFGIGAVVGIAGLIADLAPKIAAGASELGGFTREMQKADAAAHELNQKLFIAFRTPQEGIERLGQVNERIKANSQLVEQQRALWDNGNAAVSDQWIGLKRLHEVEKQLQEDIDTANKLREHGTELTKKQTDETRDAQEKLSLAGKSGRDAQEQQIRNIQARLAVENDAHAASLLNTQIETIRIQERSDAIKAGTSAAQKFFDELKSNTKTVGDLFGQATVKNADPFQRIVVDAEQQARRVSDAIQQINDMAAAQPRLARQYMGQIVEARFQAARSEVLIEQTKNADIDKATAEAAANITKELSVQADIIPRLALPVTQIPILNPEFLNAGRQQIRAATQDITSLRDATLGYMQSVMTPQEEYAVTLETLNRAYESQLINLSQLNNLARQTSPIFQQIRQSAQQMGQTITNALVGVVTGSTNARSALAGVLQSIAEIIAQMALAKAQSAVTGVIGNILGSIFGSFGGAGFGSTVGQGATNNFGGFGFGIGSNVQPFGGFRAAGGSVSPGYSYLVGEGGPERFTPNVAGSITPAGEGGDTIYIDARGTDASVVARIERAIAASEQRSVAKAVVAVRENNLRGGG